MKIETLAAIVHEANRKYCQCIGDDSQPTWDEAPDWQKESAIEGIKAIAKNPDTTPADSHANWFAHKLNDGWTYGVEKDPVAKTHPCMIPYEDLSAEQRHKDRLFTNIVSGFLDDLEWDEPGGTHASGTDAGKHITASGGVQMDLKL